MANGDGFYPVKFYEPTASVNPWLAATQGLAEGVERGIEAGTRRRQGQELIDLRRQGLEDERAKTGALLEISKEEAANELMAQLSEDDRKERQFLFEQEQAEFETLSNVFVDKSFADQPRLDAYGEMIRLRPSLPPIAADDLNVMTSYVKRGQDINKNPQLDLAAKEAQIDALEAEVSAKVGKSVDLSRALTVPKRQERAAALGDLVPDPGEAAAVERAIAAGVDPTLTKPYLEPRRPEPFQAAPGTTVGTYDPQTGRFTTALRTPDRPVTGTGAADADFKAGLREIARTGNQAQVENYIKTHPKLVKYQTTEDAAQAAVELYGEAPPEELNWLQQLIANIFRIPTTQPITREPEDRLDTIFGEE
jgi:hypothetical protein